MKRITTLLVWLLCATTIFAAEGKYGLDFSFGVSAGFQSQEGRILGEAVKLKRTDLLLPVKISTYDYFLLDNMLGIYGSISLSPLGAFMGEKVNGIEAGNMMGLNEMAAGFEFIIGPAFGIDLRDSNVRFQTGAGFHLLVAKTTTEIIMEVDLNKLNLDFLILSSHNINIKKILDYTILILVYNFYCQHHKYQNFF